MTLMLWYYTGPSKPDLASSPAGIDYTAELFGHGLLVKDESIPSGYRASEKGEAFVAMLGNTPLPIQAWCYPDGKIIQQDNWIIL